MKAVAQLLWETVVRGVNDLILLLSYRLTRGSLIRSQDIRANPPHYHMQGSALSLNPYTVPVMCKNLSPVYYSEEIGGLSQHLTLRCVQGTRHPTSRVLIPI